MNCITKFAKIKVNPYRVKGNLIFKTIIDRYIALLESSSLEIDDILKRNEITRSEKNYFLISTKE